MFRLYNIDCISTKIEIVCDMDNRFKNHTNPLFQYVFYVSGSWRCTFLVQKKKKKVLKWLCQFPSKHAKKLKRKLRNNTHIEGLFDPKQKKIVRLIFYSLYEFESKTSKPFSFSSNQFSYLTPTSLIISICLQNNNFTT